MHPVLSKISDRTWLEAWSRPAGQIGGDFIIRCETPERTTVLLADSTGHGRQGAEVAAFARPLIAREIRFGAMESLVFRWHTLIFRRFADDCRFVCFTLLELNRETRLLKLINGGNPDVLIRRANGRKVERFASTGMPLGMVDPAEWRAPKLQSTYLDPSEYAFCFSDGVTDCVGTDGDRFGLNRVQAIARFSSGRSPLRAVRTGLLKFQSDDAAQDDLSVVVLGVRPRTRCVA